MSRAEILSYSEAYISRNSLTIMIYPQQNKAQQTYFQDSWAYVVVKACSIINASDQDIHSRLMEVSVYLGDNALVLSTLEDV